jgi:hypothetical protein
MSNSITDLKEKLEEDGRYSVSLNGDILHVQADWAEVPSTGKTPEIVYVTEYDGLFEVRPVNAGAERFEIPLSEAVDYLNYLTEEN